MFYELAVLLIDEYGQPEADSPTEAIFQDIYKLVVDAWH